MTFQDIRGRSFLIAVGYRRPELQHRGFAQAQYRAILRAREFAGQQKELVSQFGESQTLPRFLQAEALESGNQVVGQANDFEEQSIGLEGARGNFYAAHNLPGVRECQA